MQRSELIDLGNVEIVIQGLGAFGSDMDGTRLPLEQEFEADQEWTTVGAEDNDSRL